MLYARRSLAQATADAPRALAVHRVRGLNSHARVTPTARRASMVAASTAAQVLVVAAPTISAAAITIAQQLKPAPAMDRLIRTAATTFALPGTAASIRIAASMDSVLRQGSRRL